MLLNLSIHLSFKRFPPTFSSADLTLFSGARAVRLYTREIRDSQGKVRGITYEKKRRRPPPQAAVEVAHLRGNEFNSDNVNHQHLHHGHFVIAKGEGGIEDDDIMPVVDSNTQYVRDENRPPAQVAQVFLDKISTMADLGSSNDEVVVTFYEIAILTPRLIWLESDADDNVKFGFSMAFSTTLLSWSIIKFGEKMGTATSNAMDVVRWGTNYLLKVTAELNKIHVQVGDPYGDHNSWERPEDMDTPRTVYIGHHNAWFGGCWAKTIS